MLILLSLALQVVLAADCGPEKSRAPLSQPFADLPLAPGATPAHCPQLPPRPSAGAPPELAPGELRSVTRKVALAGGGEKSFDFKYGYTNRGKEKTMIVIKGGPKADSWIDKTKKGEFKDYNLIVIELPGAGHNKFADNIDFGKEVGVEAAARLVKDIVAKEQPGSYVLAGHSYGTTVATAAASMITNESNMPKPAGVLLVGTVGRSTRQTEAGHEVTKGPSDISGKAYDRLTATQKEKFGELAILARETENTGKLAGALLSPLSVDFEVGYKYLTELLKLRPRDALACFDKPGGGTGGASPDDDAERKYAQKFYMEAGCELVSRENEMDTSHFFRDQLISSRPNACHCSNSKKAASYNSANWPIKNVPIFYVSAEDDFNTPPYQMEYHRGNQGRAASKTLFSLPRGGHGLGFSQMTEGGCGSALEAMFNSSPSGFQREMYSCTNPAEQKQKVKEAPKEAPPTYR